MFETIVVDTWFNQLLAQICSVGNCHASERPWQDQKPVQMTRLQISVVLPVLGRVKFAFSGSGTLYFGRAFVMGACQDGPHPQLRAPREQPCLLAEVHQLCGAVERGDIFLRHDGPRLLGG